MTESAGAAGPAASGTDALADAVRSGDRTELSRAITLVESARPDRHEQAQQLLLRLLPGARCPSPSRAFLAWASRRPSKPSARCCPGRAIASRCLRSIRRRHEPVV